MLVPVPIKEFSSRYYINMKFERHTERQTVFNMILPQKASFPFYYYNIDVDAHIHRVYKYLFLRWIF